MAEDKEVEYKPYMLIIRDNLPQNIASTVDLIEQWKSEVAKRAKTGEWWRPIEFRDEESNLIAAYVANSILGIVQGVAIKRGG